MENDRMNTHSNINISKPDVFIEEIRKAISKAATIQYFGYEQDVSRLYVLAENYLDCKNKSGFLNGTDLLIQDKKWIQSLVEIEMRINYEEKIKSSQEKDAKTLSQLRELIQEKMSLTQMSTPTEKEEINDESIGSTAITLTLQGNSK